MNLQLILVILLSVAAVFFIGFRFYKAFSGKGKSGDCPNCGVDATKKLSVKETKSN